MSGQLFRLWDQPGEEFIFLFQMSVSFRVEGRDLRGGGG